MNDFFPDFLITPFICWTEVDHRHQRTHTCQHYNLSIGEYDPNPYYISINIDPDTVSDAEGCFHSYFLNYYSESGKWITDTWHETLEDAFSQAEFEFKNSKKTWKDEENRSLLADKNSDVYFALCRVK